MAVMNVNLTTCLGKPLGSKMGKDIQFVVESVDVWKTKKAWSL
jgi:hypothetical protein